jgi:CubicO group peptidase (beta-lactamase class C family)
MHRIGHEVEPAEVGLDAERLDRIDRHLDRLVEAGRLPGWQLVITRSGQIAHAATGGFHDLETRRALAADAQYRIFSMTKPIVTAAAMMLFERGAFELNDPVARYLPEFGDPQVYVGGPAASPETTPANEPIRIRHLLTHTAGLTYGFYHQNAVDELYRAAGLDRAEGLDPSSDLAAVSRKIAAQPLLFHPGSEWNYSMATDVVGRLIEVLAGEPLDAHLDRVVFTPLGMTDTAFGGDRVDPDRVARLYEATESGLRPIDDVGRSVLEPTYLSGGGGLVSTASDYHRFTQLLLDGGRLEGVRLLAPRTVAFMTRNHLPGDADLARFGRPMYPDDPYCGTGFGLGFAVEVDPVAAARPVSPGTYTWGGAASTNFWVDPSERLTILFFTQLMPDDALPLRTLLPQLVSQALVN